MHSPLIIDLCSFLLYEDSSSLLKVKNNESDRRSSFPSFSKLKKNKIRLSTASDLKRNLKGSKTGFQEFRKKCTASARIFTKSVST